MVRFTLSLSLFTNLIYVKISMYVRQYMQTYEIVVTTTTPIKVTIHKIGGMGELL